MSSRSPTPPVDPLAPGSPTGKVCEIKFDELGDIMLVITSPPGTARFQVNSSILCLASPIFRAMLGPNSPFKEAADLAANDISHTNPLTIPLEDDANALAVILRILHLQFNSLPPNNGTIDEEQLYNMAIICDKYEMQQALGYWYYQWRSSITEEEKTSVDSSSFPTEARGPRWLFMAYAFGHNNLFTSISKDFILNSQVTSSGELQRCGIPNVGFDLFMPQGIIGEYNLDALLAARLQAIEAILDCVDSEIERYSNATSGLKCRFKHEGCDALYLGLFIREFKKLNVYPEPSTVADKSVNALKALFDGVNFHPQYLGNALPGGCCRDPRLQDCGHAHWSCCKPACIQCSNCKSRYKAPARDGHVQGCSPLPKFRSQLESIVGKIEGLQLSTLARRITPQASVLGNPWKPVEYV